VHRLGQLPELDADADKGRGEDDEGGVIVEEVEEDDRLRFM